MFWLFIVLAVLVFYLIHARLQRRAVEKTDPAFESPLSSFKNYDITDYATAKSHESRVYKILQKMPRMRSSQDVETYIRKRFPKSPLTGKMVTNSAIKHGVSVHLLLAIMQQDSGFGTKGKGARSKNPGNVGTYNGKMKVYGSWQNGVEAVAKWLKKNKKKRAGTQACRPSSIIQQ